VPRAPHHALYSGARWRRLRRLTAKLIVEWQRWVIFDQVQRGSPIGPFRLAPRDGVIGRQLVDS
jgi:hypothetical protein